VKAGSQAAKLRQDGDPPPSPAQYQPGPAQPGAQVVVVVGGQPPAMQLPPLPNGPLRAPVASPQVVMFWQAGPLPVSMQYQAGLQVVVVVVGALWQPTATQPPPP
jgi:hypothetical protein